MGVYIYSLYTTSRKKMEEAFVKFVLFVQDGNGKGNFIRKQRKRGGGWYSISLFRYRDLGASTIVEFRGKMHLKGAIFRDHQFKS